MTIYTHPNASKVIISMRLETPNRGIPYKILVVEANIPLSEENEGYDAVKLGSLLDFVWETIQKVHAEKAEIIYPPSDRYFEASRVSIE
jgi:hypothetical protein